jgi:hypothetical protein
LSLLTTSIARTLCGVICIALSSQVALAGRSLRTAPLLRIVALNNVFFDNPWAYFNKGCGPAPFNDPEGTVVVPTEGYRQRHTGPGSPSTPGFFTDLTMLAANPRQDLTEPRKFMASIEFRVEVTNRGTVPQTGSITFTNGTRGSSYSEGGSFNNKPHVRFRAANNGIERFFSCGGLPGQAHEDDDWTSSLFERRFSVAPGQSSGVTFGFYGEAFVKWDLNRPITNQVIEFSPALQITVDQDSGALIGSVNSTLGAPCGGPGCSTQVFCGLRPRPMLDSSCGALPSERSGSAFSLNQGLPF